MKPSMYAPLEVFFSLMIPMVLLRSLAMTTSPTSTLALNLPLKLSASATSTLPVVEVAMLMSETFLGWSR